MASPARSWDRGLGQRPPASGDWLCHTLISASQPVCRLSPGLWSSVRNTVPSPPPPRAQLPSPDGEATRTPPDSVGHSPAGHRDFQGLYRNGFWLCVASQASSNVTTMPLDPLILRGPFRKGSPWGLCPKGSRRRLGPKFTDALSAAGRTRRRRPWPSHKVLAPKSQEGRFFRLVQPLCLLGRSGIENTRLPGLHVGRAPGPLPCWPRPSLGLPTPHLPSNGRQLFSDTQAPLGATHLVGLLAGPAPVHLGELGLGAEAVLDVGFLPRRGKAC